MTVAPLTAAILAGVSQDEAGIGSAINNAVARMAGLIATVAIGAVVAAQFSSAIDRRLSGRPLTPAGSRPPWRRPSSSRLAGRRSRASAPRQARAIITASDQASVNAFRWGIGVASLLVGGGLIGAAGIRNPRRTAKARHCSGGQLAGAPLDAAGVHAVGLA